MCSFAIQYILLLTQVATDFTNLPSVSYWGNRYDYDMTMYRDYMAKGDEGDFLRVVRGNSNSADCCGFLRLCLNEGSHLIPTLVMLM